MAVTTWYFVVDADEHVTRVSLARMDRFFDGNEVLPHDGTAVLAVEVTLTPRHRKISRVHRVLWLRLEVDAHGHCDQAARQRHAALAMHRSSRVDLDAKVVPLGPAIAGRQIDIEHRWTPTAQQLSAIALALNDAAARPPVVVIADQDVRPL